MRTCNRVIYLFFLKIFTEHALYEGYIQESGVSKTTWTRTYQKRQRTSPGCLQISGAQI